MKMGRDWRPPKIKIQVLCFGLGAKGGRGNEGGVRGQTMGRFFIWLILLKSISHWQLLQICFLKSCIQGIAGTPKAVAARIFWIPLLFFPPTPTPHPHPNFNFWGSSVSAHLHLKCACFQSWARENAYSWISIFCMFYQNCRNAPSQLVYFLVLLWLLCLVVSLPFVFACADLLFFGPCCFQA